MLKLDHLTVVAPTLAEGAAHLSACLGIDVPFGTRHGYMGTHNHRLLLGAPVYLEAISVDPKGAAPSRPRWFGMDDTARARADWDAGRRLKGWVASTDRLEAMLAAHPAVFGEAVELPFDHPAFALTIPPDGSLPLGGAAPSLIDHRDRPTSMAEIPDLGARLVSLTLEHPEPARIEDLYGQLSIDRPPTVVPGREIRYRAQIETPTGIKDLF
ncbi:MAG: VOC family protein [Pseudomonadota bacterium]